MYGLLDINKQSIKKFIDDFVDRVERQRKIDQASSSVIAGSSKKKSGAEMSGS